MTQPRRLILASSSVYRRELLARLGLKFEFVRPEIDETPLPGELPGVTAARLSKEKACAVAASHPDALVIGSDQVASCDGRRLDKPGTHEKAAVQLQWVSGKTASFDTAVTVLDSAGGRIDTRVVPCQVRFRSLDADRIEAYLRREQPYDCAGSAKSEGLGIVLIAGMKTNDPTSLIGLPLIALSEMLEAFGLSPI